MAQDLSRAERLYRTFHQFDPADVGEFHREFKIPREVLCVGEAKTMLYTSDKLHPNTGEDEGFVSYFHSHEGGVGMYLTDGEGRRTTVPKWIQKCGSLVLLGVCDGFEYEDWNGVLREAKSSGRKPEWYCTPSGKALFVVQDKRQVLAMAWGGSLTVEWRGVVG